MVEPDPGGRERDEIRRTSRSRLAEIPIEERRLGSGSMSDWLPDVVGPINVLGYLGDGIEVDIDPLIRELLAGGARVSVPAVRPEPGRMDAIRLTSLARSDLDTDRFGIRVPRRPWTTVDLDELDVILVPGVAFTENGDRLGRGGGYYDRLLAGAPDRIRRIGVCHRVQIVGTLPTRAHDVPMHAMKVLESP